MKMMSMNFKTLFVILLCFGLTLSLNKLCSFKRDISDDIYDKLASDTKTLFKAWHLIQNKDYDYNTPEGIQKYRNFKANLKIINEHNASDSTYLKGLNHLSDMTFEEVQEYYNLRPISPEELSKNLRNLRAISLDDFNEEDEVERKPVSVGHNLPVVDWTSVMTPVRNQGQCGSCWAFATGSVLEGVFAIKKNGKKPMTDYFSTQQMVDCDAKNGGCNGGWYSKSFDYFKTNKLVFEANYKYTGKKGACRYKTATKTTLSVPTFSSYQMGNTKAEVFEQLLAKGPVAVAVDANKHFLSYKAGFFDSPCSNVINHAVVLVGFGKTKEDECNNGGEFFTIRNSWSADWGEKGHIRIKYNENNNFSCNVSKHGFQNDGFAG